MGICLSCLKGPEDDDEPYNENSRLLSEREQQNYDNDAKLREREEELDKIVNETNEQLIDTATFFHNGQQSELRIVRKQLNGLIQDEEKLSLLQKKASTNFEDLSNEEIEGIKRLNDTLLDTVKREVQIQKQGPLVIDF